MGRPEQPLAAEVGAAYELAEALRALRRAVGNPPYRQLAMLAHYSAGTLARAAAGHALPTREITLAYAAACGGDVGEWERRWQKAREAHESEQAAGAERRPAGSASVPQIEEAGGQRTVAGSAAGGRPCPAQLPPDVADFVGRHTDLRGLDAVRPGPGPAHPTAVMISAINGAAGIGKTTLAVHWAHQAIGQFPDGQLYADLHGYGHLPPAEPAQVLGRFLRALGVPPQQVPAEEDEAAATYRSLLAGQRMLVVLDNAHDSAQMRSLLPGSPGCFVVVTSRSQLIGLVAEACARPITLGLLSDGESRELLARRLGSERVAAEPEAVSRLIELCARLPQALAVAAARAATSPGLPLAVLAAHLPACVADSARSAPRTRLQTRGRCSRAFTRN